MMTEQRAKTAGRKPLFLGLALVVGLITALFGQTIYLNLRTPDPILPGWEEYDATAFKRRAEANELQLVEVYASWCPVCYAQHKAFQTLVDQGRAPKVRAIRVDFDRDIAFRDEQQITFTGALLIFKGTKRIAMGVHTTPDAIADFLKNNGID